MVEEEYEVKQMRDMAAARKRWEALVILIILLYSFEELRSKRMRLVAKYCKSLGAINCVCNKPTFVASEKAFAVIIDVC